jgi:hypothetical protein
VDFASPASLGVTIFPRPPLGALPLSMAWSTLDAAPNWWWRWRARGRSGGRSRVGPCHSARRRVGCTCRGSSSYTEKLDDILGASGYKHTPALSIEDLGVVFLLQNSHNGRQKSSLPLWCSKLTEKHGYGRGFSTTAPSPPRGHSQQTSTQVVIDEKKAAMPHRLATATNTDAASRTWVGGRRSHGKTCGASAGRRMAMGNGAGAGSGQGGPEGHEHDLHEINSDGYIGLSELYRH